MDEHAYNGVSGFGTLQDMGSEHGLGGDGEEIKGGEKPGPFRAAGLKVRRCEGKKANYDVSVGDLWKDRQALVMLFPDIKTIRCRDMLLSAALVQVHMRRMRIPLCLIFPVRNPLYANTLCGDFSLNMENVEVYADVTPELDVYDAFGMNFLRREAPRTLSQSMESCGYWMLRACCGTAMRPICCLGYGCKDNTKFLGGVFMLGPGRAVKYKCVDEDGRMKVDVDTLMAQSTKTAEKKARGMVQSVFVPV